MRLFVIRLLFFASFAIVFTVVVPFVSFQLWDPIVVLLVLLTVWKVPKLQIAGWMFFCALFLGAAKNLPPGTELLSSFAAVLAVWGAEKWFSVMSKWLVVLVQILLGSAVYRVVQVLIVAALPGNIEPFIDSIASLFNFSNIVFAMSMNAAIIFIFLLIFRMLRRVVQKRFLIATA